jgi:starch phosphorylase
LPAVLEEFYEDESQRRFLDKAIMNLSLNIPIFNTHRMAAEYLQKYGLTLPPQQQARMDELAKLYDSNQ